LPVLEVREVDSRYGGLLAVQNVTFKADAGQVTGLIGPNGAGKTTLFNVITGLQPASAGRVLVGGDDITDLKPHQRARLRVARTFQRLEVFGSLTSRENVMVAAEAANDWSDEKADPRRVADAILERIGLLDFANEPVDAMPTGHARLVELGRALAIRPQLLLLDEPSAGLDEDETDRLGDLLEELAGEGMAILLVEHDVELVMRVCVEIYVLDFGRLIAHGTPTQIQADEAVQAAYLGTESEALEAAAESGVAQ
jgi:branched-chain amino acid transport system ATP-binding protein